MEQARSIMNHAVGRSRGIKCGDNYNCIEELIVKESTTQEEAPIPETPEPVPEPIPETLTNKSIDTVEETAKQSRKKSKKFSY